MSLVYISKQHENIIDFFPFASKTADKYNMIDMMHVRCMATKQNEITCNLINRILVKYAWFGKYGDLLHRDQNYVAAIVFKCKQIIKMSIYHEKKIMK